MPKKVSVADTPPPLHGLVECSNAQYHNGPGVSKSKLDLIAQGPRRYWGAYLDPKRLPRESKPAWDLGSATHSAILEPDLFPKQFVVSPTWNNKSPSERKERDLFTEQCAKVGITVVSKDHYDLALAMRDVVHAHPHAGPLMKSMLHAQAKAEQSYFATEPTTGLLVKCRFDYLSTASGWALDLKTTRDASPRGFSKSIEQYRYDVQEAWYRHVYSLATEGECIDRWVFLAVESAPPHQIGLYTLPAEVVRAARAVAITNLQMLADCQMLDQWPDPGYSGITELSLSRWHRKELGVDDPENEFPDDY
jgi:hypothetical protein